MRRVERKRLHKAMWNGKQHCTGSFRRAKIHKIFYRKVLRLTFLVLNTMHLKVVFFSSKSELIEEIFLQKKDASCFAQTIF